MKLNKSSIMMIVSVLLTMTMVVGGTLAFLTDTDAKVNTFTMGKVDIELKEEYEHDSLLLPGVTVPKKAWIANVGNSDAWVFTTVAVPAVKTDDGYVEYLTHELGQMQEDGVYEWEVRVDENGKHYMVCLDGWTLKGEPKLTTIEGEQYLLYVYQCKKVLAANTESTVSIANISMDPRVDFDPFSNSYKLIEAGKEVATIPHDLTAGKVYVNAYAIQTEGFENADAAYEAYVAQWGEFDGSKVTLPTIPDVHVTNPAELGDAVAANKTAKIYLASGSYDMPALNGHNITFAGSKDTVIEMPKAMATNNSTIAFEGVTVKYDNAANYIGMQHTNKVTYKDCEIVGQQTLYAPEADFINCKLVVDKSGYNVWTYGATKVNFTDCEFVTGGRAVLVYNEQTSSNFAADVTFTNCTFSDDGTYADAKAAVETGSNANNTATSNKYKLTFNNCTVNGFEQNNSTSPLWGNKNSMDKAHLNVVIDGNDVY